MKNRDQIQGIYVSPEANKFFIPTQRGYVVRSRLHCQRHISASRDHSTHLAPLINKYKKTKKTSLVLARLTQ